MRLRTRESREKLLLCLFALHSIVRDYSNETREMKSEPKQSRWDQKSRKKENALDLVVHHG